MSQPTAPAPPRWMSTTYLRHTALEAEHLRKWLEVCVEEEDDDGPEADYAIEHFRRAEMRANGWLAHRERELLRDLERQQMRLLP